MIWRRQSSFEVGPETDDDLLEDLFRTLDRIGAKLVEEKQVLVGSQEVAIFHFVEGRERLAVVVETFEGIKVRGDRALVERLKDGMQNE